MDVLNMCNYFEKLKDHSEYFNPEELLNRLGGNVILFNKFIGRFYTTFENITIEIEDKIKANELKGAQALIHKLKGSSGNLCLTSIYDRSCQLEQALKSEEEVIIDNEFREFKEALNRLFNIIG